MKLFQVAFLLAFSSSSLTTVYSGPMHVADELNLNLRTSSNIITLQEQRRHNNEDIDPNAQCNTLGDPCHRDSDCQQREVPIRA